MFKRKYTEVIKIDGMSCEHCSDKVKKTLENIDGVIKVKVSLKDKQATIKSDDKLDYNTVKKTIEDLGYKVIEG